MGDHVLACYKRIWSTIFPPLLFWLTVLYSLLSLNTKMATVSEEMVALKELVFKLDKQISDELHKRWPSTDVPTTDISSFDNDEEEQDNTLDHEGQDSVEEDTKSKFFKSRSL